tara:strand:- start:932 stop:1858 length:927 start_codon:yes stop_codon:yes gene_type:complete
MAYSATSLTAAETAGFNADKPMMVTQSAGTPNDAHWTLVGTHTSTDVTAADGPATRAYDSVGSLVTKTNTASAATTTKYYNFYFSTAISFDTLIVLGHNLNTIEATDVKLQLSNNDTFSSGVINPYESGSLSGDDDRLICTNLNSEDSGSYDASGTAQRYRNVEWCRLVITHSGSKTPQIGEIILGTRHQLQRNPDIPWNNKDEYSETTDFKALTGLVKRYVAYRGQALRRFRASISSSDEIAVVDSWFNAINEGTKPFVYIETPSSGADARLMILDDTALRFPLVGPFERVLEFNMTEQPPYLSVES